MTKQSLLRAFARIAVVSLAMACAASGSVTINSFFGILTDSGGAPVPDGALWVMVHDDNDNGLFPGGLSTDRSLADPASARAAFAGRTLSVGTIIEGDRIFAVGSIDFHDEIPGTTVKVLFLDLQALNLVPGRKWAFYWFPNLTPASPTVPDAAFEIGGINEVTEIQMGSNAPMTIPSDSALVAIAVYGTSLDGTLPDSRFQAILAEPTDFAAWIGGFFPGETDPAIIGFDADPDGDGLANGVESALGIAPDTASAGLGTPVSTAPDLLIFNTTLAKQAPSDVARAWEWSRDMVHWFADGTTDGSVTVDFAESTLDDSDPVFDRVEITAASTGGPPPIRLFVRLAASRRIR